jgi:hypothetical protein
MFTSPWWSGRLALSLIALNQAIHVGRQFRSQIILVHGPRGIAGGFRRMIPLPIRRIQRGQSARALLDGAADTVRRRAWQWTELVAAMRSRRCGTCRIGRHRHGPPGVLGAGDPWVPIPAS